MANMESRVTALETQHTEHDRRQDITDSSVTDLYTRTEGNSKRHVALEASTKGMIWVMRILIIAAIGLMSTIVGSIVVHWLIAGKPGM